jgi:transcriptional regulator GlxA family with amidase domain
VLVVGYDDAELLDVACVTTTLSMANEFLADSDSGYDVRLLSPGARPVTARPGLRLEAHGALERCAGLVDTLVVVGGHGHRRAAADDVLVAHVRRLARDARRVASVCTGATVLAAAGLLDGRRATTHWAYADRLAREHPDVTVDPDPIFVRDGSVSTSAGVTSGMDLALALVEEDHGRELALAVARWLVLFLKRPGGQSQFSAQLSSQLASRQPIQELQAWIVENVHRDLSVAVLAARAGMSPRNFARVFTRELGATPALFVEIARVEAARRRLEEDGGRGVEAIAAECGFGSVETMRRAFRRRVRVSPSDYRTRFQAHPN